MQLSHQILAELQALVGAPHVTAECEVRSEYERATFDTAQRVLAVVYPGSTEELQRVVALANEHRIGLYPVSRGRNWGHGSKVPVQDRSIVVDLGRMDRIVKFDRELSYVTIEPGVTFRQLADFLEQQRCGLYLSVIGGPPDASVLANTIERGDGLGPLGDRSAQCCALEVVLGTGEAIRTGISAFAEPSLARLVPAALGPELSGLFFQSNLGIVTQMTIWLARLPAEFQGVVFTVAEDGDLQQVMGTMRELQQRGVVKPNSFALWNAYKFLASTSRFPFDAAGGAPGSREQLLANLPAALRGVRWIGMAALYSASALHAYADRDLMRSALRPHVAQLSFVGRSAARRARRARPGDAEGRGEVLGMKAQQLVSLLYHRSPFLGHPTEFSIQSVYWRKRGEKPAQLDPNRDRCGLHNLCSALPFDGAHVERHAKIVEQVVLRHGLEPNLSYLNLSERYLKAFVVIAFDRDAGDEEERARSCHDRVLHELDAAGYPPVRLGIQSMTAITPRDAQHIKWLQRLKQSMDPNDILARGRYDFRHAWADGIVCNDVNPP